MPANLIFYDTETSGIQKDFSQILQCGSIQTNRSFEELAQQNIGCRPLPWVNPQPKAMLTNKKIEFHAKFLVSAVGCLSNANIPNIKGLENFKGKYYHTGNWPKNGVTFVGKKVGQIGTGSTGIQAVPVIAEEAKYLTVFQRTANYSIPARNKPFNIRI